MPKIMNAKLTLITTNDSVTIKVKYDAVFYPFERELAKLGMRFQEKISIIGVDPSGGTSGTTLATFPVQDLQLNPDGWLGGVQVVLHREPAPLVKSRSALQEDSAAGDDDELRAQIELLTSGLPPAVTSGLTDQQVLNG